jgi:hypothetical protein
MSTRVRYVGPPDQQNRDVGAETGEGDLLEPGAVYELSDELAERLIASSVHFKPARSVTRAELNARAAELGIENAAELPNMDAVAAAIRAAEIAADEAVDAENGG